MTCWPREIPETRSRVGQSPPLCVRASRASVEGPDERSQR